MKKYKKELFLSCLATLIPVFIGLIFWNKLPDMMPTHFGANGQADDFSSKAFAVFVPSLILLAANLLCFIGTMADKKNIHQNPKIVKLILCIIPILSIFSNAMTYFAAFEIEADVTGFAFLILGATFIFIGNYMPKSKQNFTIGIKVKWTLISEENWNKTHRFAGKVWVIGGIISLFCFFLPSEFFVVGLIAILLIAILPVLYSFLYYKKQIKEGGVDKNAKLELSSFEKKTSKVSIIILVLVLTAVFLVLFTGKFEFSFGDSSFEIKATYWSDISVSYEGIESIEYREDFDTGVKTNGYSSPKLLMGQFKNEEFSYYTLYAYTKCKSAIVLSNGKSHLVINCDTTEKTKELYETLLIKTAKE